MSSTTPKRQAPCPTALFKKLSQNLVPLMVGSLLFTSNVNASVCPVSIQLILHSCCPFNCSHSSLGFIPECIYGGVTSPLTLCFTGINEPNSLNLFSWDRFSIPLISPPGTKSRFNSFCVNRGDQNGSKMLNEASPVPGIVALMFLTLLRLH